MHVLVYNIEALLTQIEAANNAVPSIPSPSQSEAVVASPNIASAANVTSNETNVATPTPAVEYGKDAPHAPTGLKLLQERENIKNVYVHPGLPRVKMAFKLLINDERMKDQTARVQKKLRKRELKDEKSDLLEDIDRLMIRKRDLIEEQRKLLENAEQVIRGQCLSLI
jgi:hypothetical protein